MQDAVQSSHAAPRTNLHLERKGRAARAPRASAGRYVVEAVEEEAPELSPDEEDGIEEALEWYRQGRAVDAERARKTIEAAFRR